MSRHQVTRRISARWLLSLIVLASCAAGSHAPARIAPAVTPLLDLRSSFWINLHQRLYAETSPTRPASPQPGAEAFAPAERAIWEAALAFYRQQVPERTFATPLSDEQLEVKQRLAQQGNAADLHAAGLAPALTAQLEAAAAVYRAHGWPADDRANHAWIDALAPRLRRHGAALAHALAEAYQTPWPALPIRAEVSVHAGPAGAYTGGEPALITISSGDPRYADDAALEMVFHEASHLLVERVERAIAAAAEAQHQAVPDDLWHALLFYTAGEQVRRALPSYTPYADKNGLYRRAPGWDRYERALRRAWQPYLDGKAELDAAIRALVAAAAAPA